jgi:hypothetical protein
MTARALTILALVTAAMVMAAAVSLWLQTEPQAVSGRGERVFPGLLERIDRLATIAVRSRDGEVTIQRLGRGWGLKERNGYPVPSERIKETVLGLAALEKVEPKTTQRGRYEQLGIEDVGSPSGKSREVTLLDDQGAVLARLIVGKQAYGLAGEGGLYVRIPEEERAWAVRGSLPLGAAPRDWVERTLIDIPADSVKEVKISHPDGQKVTVTRGAGNGESLALSGMPAGARLKRPDDLDAIAGALASLSFDDLRPNASLDFPKDKTLRANFVTSDGLAIALELLPGTDEQWFRIAAQAVSPSAGGKPVEQAGILNARTKDWVYRVPAWKLTALQRRLADLIEQPKPGS